MKAKILFAIAFIFISIYSFSSNIFAASYNTELKSDWSFYEQELITESSKASHQPLHVDLPVEFDDLNLEIENYGTFIKTITIPENLVNQQMGIELPYVYSAASIYINGDKIIEVGHVGKDANEHEIDLQTVIAPFTPTSTSIEIAIQLSSFNHIRGGFSGAPTIGEWDSIHKNFMQERYTVIFVGTIILIVGSVALTIGFMNRKEKLFFIFGLFAIVVSIRGSVEVPFIYHELPIPISYVMATRLEYMTTTICFSLYAIFIYLLYKKLYSKWYLFFNLSILLVITVISMFTEPKFFQNAFFSVFPLMILYVLYNIWIMLMALYLKLILAKSLIIGILLVFIGLVVDFLSGIGVINFPPLASIMIMFNVLIILFSLCVKYVKRMNKVTLLKDELDKMVKERTAQLNRANEELQKLVNLDSLTGIYNRHKFDETLKDEFIHALLENTPLSLLMLDLDEFKKYNDQFGHVYGDELLIQFVKIINDALPEGAIFARYGGEEFAVILPGYRLEQATELAEQFRMIVENSNMSYLGISFGKVTVSIGCAERMEDQIANEVELLRLSDERLYISKASGRNRVTAYSSE